MILLTRSPIDVDSVRRAVEGPGLGGIALFSGVVRGVTDFEITEKLVYEAYETMAIEQMKRLAEEAAAKWEANVALVHRLGELFPGETAVVTAAACAHRAEAFECCRFLIDSLKADVAIWKQEHSESGAVWIQGDAREAVEQS